MKKVRLLIIFSMFLGLIIIIGYSKKNVTMKLPKEEKDSITILETIDTEEPKVYISEPEVEENELEEELENEKIELPKEEKEEEEKEEIYNNDVSSVEIKEQFSNWQTSLNTIDMLLPDINSEPRIEKTTHVVVHFSSNAYNNQNNPYEIEDIYSIFKDYEVSSNYVIGRNGEIYIFVPENRVAYHAGPGNLLDYPEYKNRLNHYSIGIELLGIGNREEMIPIITAEKFDLINTNLLGYTYAQYESLNVLLNDILSRNVNIVRDRKHIIGHDEYNPSMKTDPGVLFDWSKIGF